MMSEAEIDCREMLVDKWLVRWACVWLFLAASCPGVAFSQPTPGRNTPEAQKAPQNLASGETAPFPGLLLDYLTAAKLTAKAEQCDARLELARAEASEQAAVAEQYAERMRAADREYAQARIRVLEVAAADAAPRWWEAPALWFGVGIVTAGAVVLATGYALQAAR